MLTIINPSLFFRLKKNPEFGAFPKSLFVKYKDVKNLIDARIAKLTRKSPKDKKSVILWIESFKQDNFYTLLDFQEGGPFVLSWVSPWQKKVSMEVLMFGYSSY